LSLLGNIRKPKFAQVVSLGLSHFLTIVVLVVIVSAKVQQAVNHIEGEFYLDGVPSFFGLFSRDFDPDHKFTFEAFCPSIAQGER
jgi:hypothetical protein